MKLKKLLHLRDLIRQAAESLPDEDALEGVELFPIWEPGRFCSAGERLRYHGELYRVLQDHTAQADWTPDAAPSLFVRVAEPGTIPEWVQPMGSEDAYRKGDQVRHTGKVWESLVDANVWEPGAPGTETLWKEI
jgi:hypothetical protein